MITQEDGSVVQPLSSVTFQDGNSSAASTEHVDSAEDGHYQTELCGLELVFSEYIQSLIVAAESFAADERVSSRDISQAIYLARLLREWAISHLTAYTHMSPTDCDPFFSEKPMPELVAEKDTDVKTSFVTPVSEYLRRFSERYGGVNYDPILLSITGELFKVGISERVADQSAHFLLLPDPKKLLASARDGMLFSVGSY